MESMVTNLDSWDPKAEDFYELSSISNKGPGRYYSRPNSAGNGSLRENIALYIRNVPLDMPPDALERVVSEFGKVLSVMKAKPNEMSYKTNSVFGIVKVESMRDALNIIEKLHKKPPLYLGVQLSRKTMSVSQTSPQEGVKQISPQSKSKDVSSEASTQPTRLATQLHEVVRSSDNDERDMPKDNGTCRSRFVGAGPLPDKNPSCVRCHFLGSKRCSVCKAWYCSKKCQMDDWYFHQERCAPPPPLEDDLPFEMNLDIHNSPVKSQEVMKKLVEAELKGDHDTLNQGNVNPPTTCSQISMCNNIFKPNLENGEKIKGSLDTLNQRNVNPPPTSLQISRCNDIFKPNLKEGENKMEELTKTHVLDSVDRQSMNYKSPEIMNSPNNIHSTVNGSEINDTVKQIRKVDSEDQIDGFSKSAYSLKSMFREELRRPHHSPASEVTKRIVPTLPESLPDDKVAGAIRKVSFEDKPPKTYTLSSQDSPSVSSSRKSLSSNVSAENSHESHTLFRDNTAKKVITEKKEFQSTEITVRDSHKSLGENSLNKTLSQPCKASIPMPSFSVIPALQVNVMYDGIITTFESIEKSFCFMLLFDGYEKILNATVKELTSGELLTHSKRACGEFVMAQSPSDQVWYRAIVLSFPSDNSACVCYVDLGNEERVTVIRRIPSEFELSVVPGLAVSATLLEAPSPEKATHLSDVIKCDVKFKLKIKDKDSNSVQALLLTENGDELTKVVLKPCSAMPQVDTTKKTDSVTKSSLRIFRSDLSTPSLNIGQEYEVLPTFVCSGGLYVQLLHCADKLNYVMEKVSSHCHQASVPQNLEKGEMVCALYDDGVWYRGEVKEITDNGARVHYIDFGNDEFVTMNNIRTFDSSLAFDAMTAFVQPIVDCSNEHFVEMLKPYVDEWIPVVIKVKYVNPLRVDLLDAAFKKSILESQSLCSQDTKKKELTSTSINSNNRTVEKSISESNPKNQTKQNGCADNMDGISLLKSGSVKPLILMYDECKLTMLPLANDVEVVVIHPSDPCNIFLTASDNSSLFVQLEELSVEMNSYCNSLSTTYYVPQEGEVCLAKFHEDGLWYRAACISVEKDMAMVIFVDYGNHDRVSFKDLCQMVDKFLDLPVIVLHCQLKGFTVEKVTKGGELMVKKFQELLPPYSSHKVNVVSKCEDSFVYVLEIPWLASELEKYVK